MQYMRLNNNIICKCTDSSNFLHSLALLQQIMTYHNILYDLLLSSSTPVDSQSYHPALRRNLPYIKGSHTANMNQLISMSYYEQLMNTETTNSFLLHMGKESPALRVGGLLGRGLPAPVGSELMNKILNPKYTTSSIGVDPHGYESGPKYDRVENKYSKAILDPKHASKFLMNKRRGPRRQKRTIDWEDRMQMLIDFKNEHGHCMVPQNHPHLGAWVKWQREKYALYEEGKKNHFTPEKIERLNDLGFVWRVRRKRTKRGCSDEQDTISQSGEINTEHKISCKRLKRSGVSII